MANQNTTITLRAALRVTSLATAILAGGTLTGCTANVVQAEPAAIAVQRAAPNTSHALYELRTYTTNVGKLDALHTRFRDHTRRLFEKHGIATVAYWTPTDQANTLIYILGHESKESAKASWAAFLADPDWQAAYAASIADGRLVENIDSVFMKKTDYSPNQ